MAIWTEVTGSILIREDAHLSLRKLVEGLCPGECILSIDSVRHGARLRHRIDWRFDEAGQHATTLIHAFGSAIQKADPSASVDFTASIRYVSGA